MYLEKKKCQKNIFRPIDKIYILQDSNKNSWEISAILPKTIDEYYKILYMIIVFYLKNHYLEKTTVDGYYLYQLTITTQISFECFFIFSR